MRGLGQRIHAFVGQASMTEPDLRNKDIAMILGSNIPTKDAAPPAGDLASRIAGFMRRASIEATRPTQADAEMLRETLPSGANIFLSAVPKRPRDEVVASARAIRAAGLDPVPHIAARSFPDAASADELLARLHGEGDVRAVLLIGGDLPSPAGSIVGAQRLIESGVLGRCGIERVGIAGYPDGHPRMSDEELESTLVTKVAAAQSAGLDVHIVTRFCFEPRMILRWIEWLRRRGLHLPVDIGFAGPTNLMTWLDYARRCGVRASAERSRGEAVSSSMSSTRSHPTRSFARSSKRFPTMPWASSSRTSIPSAASARRRARSLARCKARSPSTRKAAFWSSGRGRRHQCRPPPRAPKEREGKGIDLSSRVTGSPFLGSFHSPRRGWHEPSIGSPCGLNRAGPYHIQAHSSAALTSTRLRAGIAHSTGSAAARSRKAMADDQDQIPKRQKEFRMRQEP